MVLLACRNRRSRRRRRPDHPSRRAPPSASSSPLRAAQQPAYLQWAVGAFRLAISGVAPEVQIHTHMCYSEFNELIDTVADLDADVTSIVGGRKPSPACRYWLPLRLRHAPSWSS
ncbi:hypothetical protein [Corynebacterium diphtheriae]|nr:hypothetical protein [Corynebacterium diphtheriae]MBG9270586.1 hypothetical protein [Corynebacterium diphtheriae bv. gravis]UJM21643.1 hypothetical protein FE377_10140 [Corynebacterium diphtheriae]